MNVYLYNDTIAAVSTPPGVGAVGIIRVSGKNSCQIINKIFTRVLSEKKLCEFKPGRIYHGWIAEFSESEIFPVDEVILLYFKAPKSFTGEDVFEIQCHGGISITNKILKLCLDFGARIAEKGEFSRRAFVNGKIDLSMAESILDLIQAKTQRFSQISALNMSGRLANRIKSLREELINILSFIIAAIDFPEEVDEPEYEFISEKLEFFISEINQSLSGANFSNLMREGVRAAIVGRPNAGKSSLFNALLDMERAIVTNIPGTTRDIIQESIDIDGIPVTFADTAGIRDVQGDTNANSIEALGIELTRKALESSDIVIFLRDASSENENEDLSLVKSVCSKKIIKVASKVDLVPNYIPKDSFISVSSVTKIGLDELKNKIKDMLFQKDFSDEFCTNLRQQECLKKSKESLIKALEACEKKEIQDLILIDLKAAVTSLGEITGEVVSEEIINNIFSNFCIGK